jgi:outer membrane protein assembly complex protein YaeT
VARKFRLFYAITAWFWYGSVVLALTVDNLDPEQAWQVEEILISGNTAFSRQELLAELLTKERPWYLPWQDRQGFDPITFVTDLERLQRFYEAHGYYRCRVTHDLQIYKEKALVAVHIEVEENHPVTVATVKVDVRDYTPDPRDSPGGAPPFPFPDQLPLKPQEPFAEEAYQQGEQVLRESFLKRGHARVQIKRKAEIDLGHDRVQVIYSVQPGPRAVFGQTRVEGTEKVDPQLILRELRYRPGDQFSLEQVTASRANILGLGLFSSVQVTQEQADGEPQVVPIRVRVKEKPQRDLRIGLGYGTEDELRGQMTWRRRNWLGGGRQLSFSLKYSAITGFLAATFVQPRLLSPHTRAVLDLRQEQQDEETFLLNASRFSPRLEHRFSRTLSGFAGYRLEFAKLNNVAPATIRALGGIQRDGVLSGPSLGMVWNTTEDPYDPKGGGVVSLLADQTGEIWGGDFSFYKITAEAKKYQRLGWQTVLASRLKIGIADSVGSSANIPLFERFYAGGEKSVRGYGRRRLGPISDSDDPLGGLSLIEGSLELRRPLWQELSGALFLDFGQVSTRSLDLPLDDLEFAAGLGISYTTPVGPLRLDLGFPFDPPRGDQTWQVYFSIGQFF